MKLDAAKAGMTVDEIFRQYKAGAKSGATILTAPQPEPAQWLAPAMFLDLQIQHVPGNSQVARRQRASA